VTGYLETVILFFVLKCIFNHGRFFRHK